MTPFAASSTHHDVAIVGTGFAGLAAAAELKRSGREDFVILEQADSVGGTWRDNTYPGCGCDVQSHLYSFSFAQNPDWTRTFASQPEIRAYLERTTDDLGLRRHIRFSSAVTRAEWDESENLWRIEINGEDEITARVVAAGLGPLNRPSYPNVPGRERFLGPNFHSMEWDHSVDLAGKRVAVVGTGASAIQLVPQVARQAAHVDLYQRTAPWIVPKPDRPVTAIERFLFRRIPALMNLYRESIFWRLETRVLGFTVHPSLMKSAELVAKLHIRRQIKDPELRRTVTPDYTIGCKRILISNDYYPALCRPHVDVVTDDIAEITETGIVTTDGVEREVDVIVYGTGFKVAELLTPLSIVGRDGVDINDAWRDAVTAYLGTSVAGFPNLFVLLGPNTGLGHSSMVYMAESVARYVREALDAMDDRGVAAVDVRPEAQDAFNARIQASLDGAVWSSGCKSWYLDAHGKNRTLWPGYTVSYRKATASFPVNDYELIEAPVRVPVTTAA